MINKLSEQDFLELQSTLEGDLHWDKLNKVLYATDASVYRVIPTAVCIPKNQSDLTKIISFCNNHAVPLIPRAAGTSLAGQVVGEGIVVDISKDFVNILEFNQEEQWVRVQPGVVRDQLNQFLEPYGFFFSPITSTANRATLGGMLGNNSSGTSSIKYGTTRDHIISVDTILSDGSITTFGPLNEKQLEEKRLQNDLEGSIYKFFDSRLSNQKVRDQITKEFPKTSIHRRNTGYAVDILMDSMPFNVAKLLCGSEGTLAFTTELKVHVDKLPPKEVLVVAAHFDNLNDSLLATKEAMKFEPFACELMDKIILDCTLENKEQRKNRFFVDGDPQAILMVEFRSDSIDAIDEKANNFIAHLKSEKLGFSFPIVKGEETKKVWKLRSAGLGLLANIPGDKKAVACIEDTAVDLDDLPEYIEEFTNVMESFGQESVYYAHAGAGEIHLRPILNLKDSKDVQAFYDISLASAKLVKKYNGSLSGEHGDGRVRAAFIEMMVGKDNYQLFRELKQTWDPNNIFNPGKIVDAPPMNDALRYEPDQMEKKIDTVFDFSSTGGILRTAEKCNGSGDCRKSHHAGGTMCPSYHATKNEEDTTRGRANLLREMLSQNNNGNRFDHDELKEVMDLCISCKACQSECPSNVDMSTLKAEFQHQYYKSNKRPLRSKLFSNINSLNKLGSYFPWLYNSLLSNSLSSKISKQILGIASERNLPTISKVSLRSWYNKHYKGIAPQKPIKELFLFCDEFSNFQDVNIGIKTIELLCRLGYAVNLIKHKESGRAAISKGMLSKAKKCAESNVRHFHDLISEEKPLIGIEPSAILSFRDEYPRIVSASLQSKAEELAKSCFTIEEFISNETKKGLIKSSSFHEEQKQIIVHGHCHQKALSDVKHTLWILSLPSGYIVSEISSGCCGMAGSFGYEKEHFDVSRKIANLSLVPAINSASDNTVIIAAGTSCRHQIYDFTKRNAMHPVELLHAALI